MPLFPDHADVSISLFSATLLLGFLGFGCTGPESGAASSFAVDTSSDALDPAINDDTFNATVTGSPSAARGVWSIWSSSTEDSMSSVKGCQAVVSWANLPHDVNGYDWSPLEKEVANLPSGKPFIVQVNGGDIKPAWIWSTIAKCGTSSRGEEIPQWWGYTSAGTNEYLDLQRALIHDLRAYIYTRPWSTRVLAVRVQPNAVGTEHFDCTANSACSGGGGAVTHTTCDAAAEARYKGDIKAKYLAEYATTNVPNIIPLLRWYMYDGTDNTDRRWVFGTGTEADPTHASMLDADDAAMTYVAHGKGTGYWEPYKDSSVYTHPVSWNYWRVLRELHKGVSFVAVYGADLAQSADANYSLAFTFANKYAGMKKRPSSTPGAWVAFRGYAGGEADISSPYENYSMFMTQISPNTYDVAGGYDSNEGANILPAGSAQPYGRSARRVNPTHNGIYLKLDPTFAGTLPGKSCTLNVRYLTSGSPVPQFKVIYGSGASDQVTSPSTAGSAWRLLTKTFPCDAATVLNGDLAQGAFISIKAITGTSSLHMVELTRQ